MIENMGVGSCLSYGWVLSSSAGPSPCGNHATTDGWQYYMPRPDSPFELVNKVGGYCLGEQSVKGGVPVVASCNGAHSQQWRRVSVTSGRDSFVNVESGLCLTATGSDTSGTIDLESCNEQPNELWTNDGTI